jgi:prepilin-type N-terminal cleavage/methylation domain-containing protein
MTRAPIRKAGFTIIELLIVVVIVSILGTLSMPTYGYLRLKAGGAVCASNLRLLGVALNGYLQDHSMIWPQLPKAPFAREQDEWAWWENTMREYGVGRRNWICPSEADFYKLAKNANPNEFVSSYIVTQFDEFPNTAFRWNQPWIMERGGFHGKNVGPNMLMPDGSITQAPAFPTSGR